MMDEKKIKTEVVGVQMHMCTILMMIILPFLILMAFLTLLALLTPTYSNDGLRFKTKINEGEKFPTDEQLSFENPNQQNLIITGFDQKSKENQTEISIPIIFRVIKLFFLMPRSNETDLTKERENVTGDTINNKNYENRIKEESNDKENVTKHYDVIQNDIKTVQKEKENLKTDLIKEVTKQKFHIEKNEFIFNNKSSPLNFEFYDFEIPNSYFCPNDGADLKLLILIHSSVENFEERNAIRETWGRTASSGTIKYAFVVSIVDNDNLDNKLIHESHIFKDIIQTNLAQIKDNEAAKSVLSLKWIIEYCPKVKYIFKTNDDVFVNVPQIDLFLNQRDTKEDRMYGFLFDGMKPERNPKNIDYIGKDDYPYEYLPNYLATEGYIFASKSVPILYDIALKSSYLPIESIYITGILAEIAGIVRENLLLYSTSFPDLRKENKCDVVSYTFVFHPLSHQGFRKFWDDLKSTGFKCGEYIRNVRRMLSNGLNSEINERFVYGILAGDADERFHSIEDEAKNIVKNGLKSEYFLDDIFAGDTEKGFHNNIKVNKTVKNRLSSNT